MSTEKKYICVVLEVGSCLLRAGYAGESAPRCEIEWNNNDEAFEANRSGKDNRRRLVVLLQRIFIDVLQVRPKDCHVLIVEGFGGGRKLRDALALVLLRDLKIIAISLQPDLSMSALASGCSYSLVLDIGHKECKAVACADGCVLLSTFTACACGVSIARDVFRKRLNSVISKNLSRTVSDILFDKVAAFSNTEVIQLPATGSVLVDEEGDNLNAPTAVPSEFITNSLFSLTKGESAYDGEVHLDDMGGAAGVLLSCLKKCPVDLRRVLASRVIVCGGGASIKGVVQRIILDAVELAAGGSLYSEYSALRPCVEHTLAAIPLPFKRSHMAWVGGSLFATEKGRNAKRFIRSDDLGAAWEDGKGPAEDTEEAVVLPDWQSISSKDWAFFSPLPPSKA